MLIEDAEYIFKYYCGVFLFIYTELLLIKGIGSYIANAIMCFAYNEPYVVMNVNAINVIERVFVFKS